MRGAYECSAAHLNPHRGHLRNVEALEGPGVSSSKIPIILRNPIPDRDTALLPLPEGNRLGLKDLHRAPLFADVRTLGDERTGGAAKGVSLQVGGARVAGGLWHAGVCGVRQALSSVEGFYNQANIQSPKNRRRFRPQIRPRIMKYAVIP